MDWYIWFFHFHVYRRKGKWRASGDSSRDAGHVYNLRKDHLTLPKRWQKQWQGVWYVICHMYCIDYRLKGLIYIEVEKLLLLIIYYWLSLIFTDHKFFVRMGGKLSFGFMWLQVGLKNASALNFHENSHPIPMNSNDTSRQRTWKKIMWGDSMRLQTV